MTDTDVEKVSLDAQSPRVPANAVASVTGIVQDSGGNPWPNCTIQCTLVSLLSKPALFIGDGTKVTPFFNTLSDGNGNFTLNLARNDAITPLNSRWQIAFTPQGSSAAHSITLLVNSNSMVIAPTTAPFSDNGLVKLVQVQNEAAATYQSGLFPNNIYWW